MNKQTEALKMAIERLEVFQMGFGGLTEVINACKEALEQQSQEPVAWMAMDLHTSWLTFQKESVKDAKEIIPLYTHPCVLTHSAPSWQGLNEYRHLKWCIEQYRDCVGFEQKSSKFQSVCEALEEVDAIEQALKEKNT